MDDDYTLDEDEKQRIYAGDPAAMARFARHFGPVFLAAVKKVLLGTRRDEVTDILHDVWTEFFRNPRRVLDQFDPARAPIRAYLYWFARRTTLTVLRQRRRRGDSSAGLDQVPDAAPHSEGRVLAKQELQSLLDHVERHLDPVDRVIFEEGILGEVPSAELGTKVGLSEAAVNTRKRRIRVALSALRRQWEAVEETAPAPGSAEQPPGDDAAQAAGPAGEPPDGDPPDGDPPEREGGSQV